MWNIGDALFNDFDEDTDAAFTETAIVADPGLDQENLDVTPVADGAAYSNVDPVADAWFTQADYKGAFGSDNWLDGLSILSGSFNELDPGAISHCGSISADETWSQADAHVLTCQTFVESGVTLTIEAGTTVKSLSDDGNGLAPALVWLSKVE